MAWYGDSHETWMYEVTGAAEGGSISVYGGYYDTGSSSDEGSDLDAETTGGDLHYGARSWAASGGSDGEASDDEAPVPDDEADDSAPDDASDDEAPVPDDESDDEAPVPGDSLVDGGCGTDDEVDEEPMEGSETDEPADIDGGDDEVGGDFDDDEVGGDFDDVDLVGDFDDVDLAGDIDLAGDYDDGFDADLAGESSG